MNKSQSSLIFKSSLVLIGLISFFFAVLYFVKPKVIEKEKIVYSFIEVDSTSIVTKARTGWIPKDSLLKVLALKNKTITKTLIDTLVLTDTVTIEKPNEIVYVKYFYTDSTYLFNKITDKWELNAAINFNTKFYPALELFENNATLNKIDLRIEQKKCKFNYWHILGGAAVGFLGKAAYDELNK